MEIDLCTGSSRSDHDHRLLSPAGVGTVFCMDARCPVLHVSGELDLASAPLFLLAVDAALGAAPQAHALVLDLEKLSFCDASGIGALIRARRAAEAAGVSLHITRPTRRMERLLSLCRLRAALPLHPTHDAPDACHIALRAVQPTVEPGRIPASRPPLSRPAPPCGGGASDGAAAQGLTGIRLAGAGSEPGS
ncbi:STAS domain-containing protein [Streptacidiphilus rugosus]|uniref:STAS domain-containing protein n=1 Tax=Streptacidiphilus rugosus TaxID=405783 RepID=UPI000690C71C|nr:STAS domain-containing protein [Streptacidiphilus rugosus]